MSVLRTQIPVLNVTVLKLQLGINVIRRNVRILNVKSVTIENYVLNVNRNFIPLTNNIKLVSLKVYVLVVKNVKLLKIVKNMVVQTLRSLYV